jgi:hypothetical protein
VEFQLKISPISLKFQCHQIEFSLLHRTTGKTTLKFQWHFIENLKIHWQFSAYSLTKFHWKFSSGRFYLSHISKSRVNVQCHFETVWLPLREDIRLWNIRFCAMQRLNWHRCTIKFFEYLREFEVILEKALTRVSGAQGKLFDE